MAPLKPRPLYKRIYWWISFLSRQTAFIICLLPAYIVFFFHYISKDRIAVYYKKVEGEEENDDNDTNNSKKTKQKKTPYFSRNYLDVYGSKTVIGNKDNNTETNIEEDDDVKKPIVIFIVGGAWTIGYKMWGCLLARALVPFGILVIIPDYRNYPKTDIQGMVNDVDTSIQWVMDNAHKYGGDNKRIVLVGQSAGAHLATTVIARKVLDYLLNRGRDDSSKDEAKEDAQYTKEEVQFTPLKSTYKPWQLCGLVSTSGPLNLVAMENVLHDEGIVSDKKQMKLFLGEGGLRDWSPYHLFQKCHDVYNEKNDNTKQEQQQLKALFPKMCIIQGTADKTVPESEALSFITLLSNLDIPAISKVYKDWSHTDAILEKPMAGDHTYHADIHELVCSWTAVGDTCSKDNDNNGTDKDENLPLEFDLSHPILRPICPLMLVNAGRYCNPF